MNRNFEDTPTNFSPGVTVAHLDLGLGTWVLQCSGPGDGSIHIINAIFSATLPGSLTLR